MTNNKKILIIGDLHLKEQLSYSNYVKDGRIIEKQEIVDFIVNSSMDCDTIVFMGDQLNAKNNTSETLRYFVNFLERFKDKKLYILAGNHESFGDGRSALDFLKEIKNKEHWTIITNSIFVKEKMTFCPYFTLAELGVKDDVEGTESVMKQLNGGDILFCHHAISDTLTTSGIKTNVFREVVLDKTELEKKYKLVVGGHIHQPQANGKILVAGSVFKDEVNETQKYIWKIDQNTLQVQQIKLPGRDIVKIENPTIDALKEFDKSSIIKAVFTDTEMKDKINEIKEELKKFDAYLLVEQYPNKRKKMI